MRSRGFCASLTAAALLGCGATGHQSATTSMNAPSTMPSTPAATGTTSVAAAPPAPGARTENWIDLAVGDCLTEAAPTDPSVVTVTVVDCAAAHEAEVYFRGAMAVNAAIADVANRQCAAGFSQYTGRSITGSPFTVTYLIDSDQDRTSANPAPSTVICLLQAANGRPVTGSARR